MDRKLRKIGVIGGSPLSTLSARTLSSGIKMEVLGPVSVGKSIHHEPMYPGSVMPVPAQFEGMRADAGKVSDQLRSLFELFDREEPQPFTCFAAPPQTLFDAALREIGLYGEFEPFDIPSALTHLKEMKRVSRTYPNRWRKAYRQAISINVRYVHSLIYKQKMHNELIARNSDRGVDPDA